MPEWVFCSMTGTTLDQHNAAKAFRRALTKAKLSTKHSPYDLRHTFATLLLADGAPITYVAKQLGHSKPTTTLQWYAHWLPDETTGYVDSLDSESVLAADLAANTLEGQKSLTRPEGFEPPTLRSEVTIRNRARHRPMIYPRKIQRKSRDATCSQFAWVVLVWHRWHQSGTDRCRRASAV
jgi:Phage integrase family